MGISRHSTSNWPYLSYTSAKHVHNITEAVQTNFKSLDHWSKKSLNKLKRHIIYAMRKATHDMKSSNKILQKRARKAASYYTTMLQTITRATNAIKKRNEEEKDWQKKSEKEQKWDGKEEKKWIS